MTAIHPSSASGVADRMALAIEELLVATSPEGILGRLCAPLFWVLGKLMERKMRREMEKLVAILREIAKNGLPVPAPIEPVEYAERGDSHIKAGGTGEPERSGGVQDGLSPSECGPSGAFGAWYGAGEPEERSRGTEAGVARHGSDAGCVDAPVAPTPREELIAAGRRYACRSENVVKGPPEPVLGGASRDPGRTMTRMGQDFSGLASAFGRSLSGAGGGRARSGLVCLMS